MSHEHFELVEELPHRDFDAERRRLVGFDTRYHRIKRELQMLLEPDSIAKWSKKFHHTVFPAVELLRDRHPLVVFHGDVGTGKTATAECLANRMTRELRKDGWLLKLSTRVRGKGLHGGMTTRISDAFDQVVEQAGKRRLAFLLIDEADAVATSRDGAQLHQEERAGTNTIIQRLDDLRRLGGRAVVFLATNRLSALDPAILRRAARIEEFTRPNDEERRELLQGDLEGLELGVDVLDELVRLTGPSGDRPGFTFADLRTKLIPNAISEVYPDQPLTADVLFEVARSLEPSRKLRGE